MKSIILASASPRRSDLMRQLGLPFAVRESGIDEEAASAETNPSRLALGLALAKAEAVASQVSDGVIIGADTVVCIDGEMLGKPKDRDEAARMLILLSGREHLVLTGLALISMPGHGVRTHVETTRVFMRRLEAREIEWYLDSREPYDKAGGYGIQGKAAVFVEKLDGCYFNVVGLPLTALWQELKGLGIRIWEGAGYSDNKAPDHKGLAQK